MVPNRSMVVWLLQLAHPKGCHQLLVLSRIEVTHNKVSSDHSSLFFFTSKLHQCFTILR